MDRRRFLLSVLALAAGPSLDELKKHLQRTGTPLLRAPASPERVLYVNREYGNLITLGAPAERDPYLMTEAFTLKEVLWRKMGWWDLDYRPTRAEWMELVED